MAGDTQATTEHQKSEVKNKVFTIKGWLVGYAGDYGHCLALVKEMRNSRKNPLQFFKEMDPPPHIKASKTELLLLSPKGKIYHYEGELEPIECPEPYYAIGHDAAYAIGAMHAGATPENAVKASMKHGTCTGGRVTVRRLSNAKG